MHALLLLAVLGWPVTTAPLRVTVARAGDAPWPARVGVAQIGTGALDPVRCQVYVTTTNGAAVGCRRLWAAPGEPLTVIFDASSEAEAYQIYLTPQVPPASPAWEPDAGVLVETRQRAPGPVESWAQMLESWKNATPVQGRSVLPQLYLGANPHGPARGFAAYYLAKLRIENAGEYALATISGDASFLFVDGKPLAQWPGAHGPWDGRWGRYSGKVRLNAGLHTVEYYHAHLGNEPIASVAWQPPGRDRFEVIPAKAFGAVARFNATGWDNAPSNPTGLYLEWRARAHATVQGLHVVAMQFRVPGLETNESCRWTFDDRGSATGAAVDHVFARPGMRAVSCEVRGAKWTGLVHVHPRWDQLEEWPADVWRDQKAALRQRGLATLPVKDLAYLVQYANILGEHNLLNQLGDACQARQTEFTAAEADTFYALGLHYQNLSVRNYAAAEKAYRVVLAFADADALLRHRVTLRLADVLSRYLARPVEAETVLDKLDANQLAPDEKRLQQILRADFALARGDLAAARQGYAAVAPPPVTDARETVRRQARLEGAQALLARGNLDDAERTLREIVWQTPAEQMSMEVGTALLNLHLARKELPVARQQCLALLRVATADTDRAALLYQLAELEFALGREAGAREAIQQLLRDHPYTEHAARAKDKWGGAMK